MSRKLAAQLALLVLPFTSTSCSGRANEAIRDDRTLANGVKSVAGTELVGSVIPVLPFASFSDAFGPPDWPTWWALLKVRAPAARVLRGFGAQARSLGLHSEGQVGCFSAPLGAPKSCRGAWGSATSHLAVEVNECGGCRGVSEIASVSFASTEGPRSPPTTVGTRRAKVATMVRSDVGSLGPAVRVLLHTDFGCDLQIGEVTSDAEQVWRRWNIAGPSDNRSQSWRGSYGDLTVRWATRSGMDYDITVTLIEGPGLRRPVLVREGCS